MNKKGQASAGMVTALVMGIAGLVIGVIVAFVIVSTLTGAELLTSGRTTTTVTNETSAWLNATDYTLDGASTEGSQTFTLTAIWANDSGLYNLTVPTTNATVSAAGVVVTADADDYGDVSYSYTYVVRAGEELSTEKMSGNFTSGIDKVSSKLPTVLLVAAIVLILGILAVLVAVWQRMKMGQGGL